MKIFRSNQGSQFLLITYIAAGGGGGMGLLVGIEIFLDPVDVLLLSFSWAWKAVAIMWLAWLIDWIAARRRVAPEAQVKLKYPELVAGGVKPDDRHELGCVRRYGAVPERWVPHADCSCHEPKNITDISHRLRVPPPPKC